LFKHGFDEIRTLPAFYGFCRSFISLLAPSFVTPHFPEFPPIHGIPSFPPPAKPRHNQISGNIATSSPSARGFLIDHQECCTRFRISLGTFLPYETCLRLLFFPSACEDAGTGRVLPDMMVSVSLFMAFSFSPTLESTAGALHPGQHIEPLFEGGRRRELWYPSSWDLAGFFIPTRVQIALFSPFLFP